MIGRKIEKLPECSGTFFVSFDFFRKHGSVPSTPDVTDNFFYPRFLFSYCRNRLENNSDHWNALFLSLRELAEWTVKKEAELEAMSPVGGDEVTVRKQQVLKPIG